MPRFPKLLPAVLALVTLAAGAISLTNCGSTQAQARFVAAIADIQAVDVFVNGTRYFNDVALSGNQYYPSSGYVSVPAGSVTMLGYVTGTSSGTPVFTLDNVNLNAGTSYTVVASGPSDASYQFLATADNNNEPADGTVSFRIINAAPNAGTTIYAYVIFAQSVVGTGCNVPPEVGSTPQGFEAQLSYNAASTYENLLDNPSGYTLYVCNAPNGTPLVSGYPLGTIGNNGVGSIRTIVLTDNSGGTALAQDPIVLKDLN